MNITYNNEQQSLLDEKDKMLTALAYHLVSVGEHNAVYTIMQNDKPFNFSGYEIIQRQEELKFNESLRKAGII